MTIPSTFTAGPWTWQSFDGGKTPFLGTPDRGRLVVMDFARVGMNGAGPRFALNRDGPRAGGIMRPFDMKEIAAHPDARLIAKAPELFTWLQALVSYGTMASAGPEDVQAALAEATKLLRAVRGW